MLWIPSLLLILSAILWMTVALEQQILSPRAYAVRVVRARRATPEYAESLIASQFASIIRRTD